MSDQQPINHRELKIEQLAFVGSRQLAEAVVRLEEDLEAERRTWRRALRSVVVPMENQQIFEPGEVPVERHSCAMFISADGLKSIAPFFNPILSNGRPAQNLARPCKICKKGEVNDFTPKREYVLTGVSRITIRDWGFNKEADCYEYTEVFS